MTAVSTPKPTAIERVRASSFPDGDRMVVHSVTGGPLVLGADWDADAVVDFIEHATAVEWTDTGVAGHQLCVVGQDNVIRWFDVAPPEGTFQ